MFRVARNYKPMSQQIRGGQIYEQYKGKFKCPECDVELYISRNGANGQSNPAHIYCGHGRCSSRACADGAESLDIEDALRKLAIKHYYEWAGDSQEMTTKEHADYTNNRTAQIRSDGL